MGASASDHWAGGKKIDRTSSRVHPARLRPALSVTPRRTQEAACDQFVRG
ncbi:MAG TPA: hypothetical protein VMD30_02850 [Tepidisphaeraceae bacterium]|nr:hypothetical protein [Tepidisphaeraceae bacterium]